MSSSDGDDGSDAGPGTREVAHRIFAAEFDDADLDHSESDEERAPNYVVTPTGLRVNRLFAVGVLTEVESVNEQTLRGRVVDPTGAFVTYAGQYQPDEAAFLDRTAPPAFVALTGKARTFQPEDSDLVYTSVRPESLATVDADTRDRWVVSAAEATLRRIAVFAEALAMDERGDRLRARLEDAGVPAALAAGVPLAIDHYDTGHRYLEAVRTLAVDSLAVVADEREEVRALTVAPVDRGGADLGSLPDVPYDFAGATAPEAEFDDPVEPAAAGTDAAASTASTVDESSAGETERAGEPAEAADATGDDVAVAEADPGAGAEPEPVESADATRADEPEDDDPIAGGTAAAGSTESLTDAPDESGGDGGEAAAAEPAEAAGADDDAAVAEADPGADAEPEPVESAGGGDLGDFEDPDDGPGEFDAGGAADASGEPASADAADEAGAPEEADDLGEFDADADADPANADADPEDLEDALSEEERREVEAEHGVEFSTGSEVPDAGESGIETPDPDTGAGDTTGSDESTSDPSSEPADAEREEPAGGGSDDGSDDEADASDAPADVDLESAVVDVMSDLDDGDGVDREAVVAAAVDRHGADPGDAEDAIQEALMSGKCYEPADGTLKPI
ncbi:hypothetical protein [Halobaculum gomorrense]|uniref:Rpa-associated protein n=1 Tax=Halobaculum gomorrense TaxID=43928 RepID=A0A1M5KJC0_9EURY|nr:hypothetical protein [Halobaculum gomorrense]SHG52974.1 hypothetical protein SAMN05443636_0538 [Halobaculum gomorrense]